MNTTKTLDETNRKRRPFVSLAALSATTNMPKAHQHHIPENLNMKALIIYNDFASAAKANAALQRSALNLDFAVRWDVRPWRIDTLKFPPTAEEALTDAIDAHLIIFAGRSTESLPFWLLHWLEHWAKCRHFEGASLGVIDSRFIDTVATTAASQLTSFAKCHGLSFVTDDGKVREGKMMPPIHVAIMDASARVPFNCERPSVDGMSF